MENKEDNKNKKKEEVKEISQSLFFTLGHHYM